MYVRFATLRQHEESHSPTGVFQAAYALRNSGALARYEERQINDALEWFGTHLDAPECLEEPEHYRAICWFRHRAVKPMRYIWPMVHVLNEHGVYVRLYKTDDPGIVIYEDDWQVAAKPRRKRRRR